MTTIDQIMNAATWKDIFPADPDAARKEYRVLLRTVHPDVCSDSRAGDAFIKLRQFYTTYRANPADTGTTGSTTSDVTELISDPAFLFFRTGGRLFWVTRNSRDNDRAEAMSEALKKLKNSRSPQFFPEFISTFRAADGRRGVEVKYPDGVWNLSKFEKLDDRNTIWVFKRIIVALMLAHEQGLIHGNVHPNAIMVLPEDHGLILDGWGYSVNKGEKLKIKPEGHVPAEYLKGKEADEWADISAAGAVALEMAHDNLHPRLERFFKSLRDYKELDAGLVLRDFNEMTEEVFGAPKFHVLENPGSDPIR